MKVLHVSSGLKNGGAEAILFRIVADTIQDIQHEVISLSEEGFYADALRSRGVKVTALQIESVSSVISRSIKLFKLIRLAKPDVVQTWMYHADILGGTVAWFAGIKKIFWGVHSTFLNPKETKTSTKLAVKFSKYLSYFIPFKIICCSEVALKSHQTIGYCLAKMTVIHNGFDTNYFIPDILKKDSIRKSLHIGQDVFLMGMVARWHPVKDHKTLFSALQKLTLVKYKWKCLLVGHEMTNENQPLNSLIRENGLEDFVLCLGSRQDIAAILNMLDLHILTSYSESFGNVTAEAMSCSVPCIMTDVGEAKNLLSGLGWIVEPRNALQLTEMIQYVYDEYQDKEKWNLLKSNCRKKIIENYSIVNMVHAYTTHWVNDK